MNTRTALCLCACCIAMSFWQTPIAQATSGSWGGSTSGYWTNSLNWSASPYPSGSDTATFNGTSANTAIDIAGLSGILNITFDSANVAAYTVGASGSQTNILRDGGEIKLSSTAANSQTFNAAVRLGPDATSANYSLRNDNAGQTLTFGTVIGSTGGTKSLNLNGVGPISILGGLNRGSSAFSVYANSSSAISLGGSGIITLLQMNGTNGVINLAEGTTTTVSDAGGSGLMAAQDYTINGPGALSLSTSSGDNHLDNGAATGKTLTINAKLTGATGFEYWHGSYYGTIALYGANDYTLTTIINVPGTIQFNTLANTGSACSLGTGSTLILNGAGARYCYVGTGDTSDRTVDLRTTPGILEQAGSGTLKLTTAVTSTSTGAKTLVLQGSTDGTGELAGGMANGSATLSLMKTGTGTWTFSGACSYSGMTFVSNGVLAVSGEFGAISNTSAVTINTGASLSLINAASANNTNRLSDSAPIAMTGSALNFVNDAGTANFSETIGALTFSDGINTIAVSQAAEGRTSVLRLASLTRNSGYLNFVGTGIGENDRNRVFITAQADGPIGSWATVNGTQLAGYTSTGGVYAITGLATYSIAARGPDSVIPDDANADVHINTDGTDGPITLAGSPTDTIFSLQQDDAVAASVQLDDGVTSKTLLANALKISTGAASLTVGENAGDGIFSSPADNVLLANDEPTATLTLNAPIINNGSRLVSIDKTGAGDVVLAGANTYSGATAIAAGTLTFANSGTTQTLAGAISGVGALKKSGSGLLVLAGQNTYTGLTTIAAGTILAQTNQAFGGSAAGTVVADGATLDVGANRTANTLMINAESFTVSGSGVNNRGAIINSSASSQYNALSYVTLAGDTTFGGENVNGRWDLRNTGSGSTFQMNGYTLTKVGANTVGLTAVTVTPGAGSIDIQEGTFTIEASTSMGGSADNVMRVRGGAVFDLYNFSSVVPWALTLEESSHVYVRNGNSTSLNVWGGPVTLNGTAFFDAAGSFSDTFRGPISGAGSVVKATSGSTTYFTGTNTYAGTTTVSNGTLNVPYARALPGYDDGRLTLAAPGILALTAGDGTTGWNSDQISVLHDASQLTTNAAVLSIDTSLTELNYTGDFTKPMALTKTGTNRLSLAGYNTFGGTLTVNGGELAFSGATTNAIGNVYIYGASSIVLSNAAPLYVNIGSNCSAYVGYNSTDFGRMTVAGNATWAGYLYPYNVAQSTLVIGQSGRGILTIQDNASITQKLYIGNNSTAAGAVYQNGGVMHNWGGAASDPRFGVSGYGYYELNSGTFTNNGYTQLGEYNAGVGILRVNGGDFKMGSIYGGQLGVSRSGTGQVYVAGGTFATSTGINLCEASDNGVIRGYADFTMGKTAGPATVAGTVNMADRTNCFATLNLNGGTLTANIISKSSSRTGSVAIVNFDGGTFRARTSGNLINTGANTPDAVNIYAGGATIDTTNLVCALAVPLQAPAGSGVSAIALTPRGGYIGPPFITISGGGGTGATAVAEFDSASGYVTGATVTCPGIGYTSTPTVSLSGGGTNVHTSVASVTLAANTSGGLTKLGSGTLTLSATNTYQGATVVSNGILALGAREALPNGTDLVLAGGSLNLGGFTLTNDTVTLDGGSLVNGQVVGNAIVKTGSGTATLAANIDASSITIHEGVVRFQGAGPGLYEAPVNGSFNTTEAMSTSIVVRLTTRMANIAYTEPYNVTWIYQGFIWNRASTNVTWTFIENFDDSVKLLIDGNQVLYNTSWNTPSTNNYTLVPGAHAFEARFGQGIGGGGPPTDANAGWFATGQTIGFGYDPLGRGEAVIANYQAMVDPGDGSLFTLTVTGSNATNLLNAGAALEIDAGAALDLNGFCQSFASVAGSGTVSNGALAVSGAIMPGGDGTVGTLTLAACTGVSGTLRIDVDATSNDCDVLAIDGDIDLSQLALEIANPEALDKTRTYTLMTVLGTRSGAFSSVSAGNSRWHAIYGADGSVTLTFVDGTLIELF